jgi:hypothetical protein
VEGGVQMISIPPYLEIVAILEEYYEKLAEQEKDNNKEA